MGECVVVGAGLSGDGSVTVIHTDASEGRSRVQVLGGCDSGDGSLTVIHTSFLEKGSHLVSSIYDLPTFAYL